MTHNEPTNESELFTSAFQKDFIPMQNINTYIFQLNREEKQQQQQGWCTKIESYFFLVFPSLPKMYKWVEMAEMHTQLLYLSRLCSAWIEILL